MKKELVFFSVIMSTVVFADTHYVHLDSPSPTPPYADWFTAATNIQDAVDVSVDGDEILVAGGHYILSSRITITNSITVTRADEYQNVIIDGNGQTGGFYLSADCLLSGLTITNCFSGTVPMWDPTWEISGIYCTIESAVVSNCTVIGCSGTGMSNGTAYDCQFIANSTFSYGGKGGGMIDGTAINCTFTSNSAAKGGGMSGGTASNCIFKYNTAISLDGGGMFNGDANSCLFISNSANSSGGGMSEGTANNCIFESNVATMSRGGGMRGGVANSCLFISNSAYEGGGMSEGMANNCTFISNSAGWRAGGIIDGTVNNCIFWENSAGSINNDLYQNDLYQTIAQYCCSLDLTNGVDGNITNNPVFADPTNGNYRISTDSPCFNAGNNSYVVIPTDLDGLSRIAYVNVDMGAYEVTEDYNPGDDDSDGLSNYDEIIAGTNLNDPDTDDDGLTDGDEVHTYLTDPTDSDSDNDGLSDGAEINTHSTDPNLYDSDGDGLSDGAELNTYHTDPNISDMDSDGLKDGQEILTYYTNPQDADTDDDGFDDGYEVSTGYDPTLASSTPDTVISIYTAVEVHFNAASGSVYRVEGTDSLSNSWSTVESGIPGNGGIITRLYSTLDQPNRFFRATHE